MVPVIEYAAAELVVVFGTLLLISLLLAELFDWAHLFTSYDNVCCSYGYNSCNGPLTWKCKFPNSRGNRQSPINIQSCSAVVLLSETLQPLKFSPEYHLPPKEIRAYNDGHSVTIYARWLREKRPTVCGGPLNSAYQFYNLRFRWGPNDEEGSEHTIDAQRYALEIQATHVKTNTKCEDLVSAAGQRAILIISYFYQITPVDNPYLEPIITKLNRIQRPFSRCSLEPLPISWLIPPFTSKYYSYEGSLTHPPCTEGVKWIIQPESLCISSRQVRKFRKLMSLDGSLEINTRPVQDVNSRDIFFYD